MLELRNHGQSARYRHTRIGLNGRLDTLQAAILLAKLEVFDEELAARDRIARQYTALLRDAVQTPRVLPNRTSAWAQYTIEVADRDALPPLSTNAGIPTAVHYPTPLHLQPVYTDARSPKTLGPRQLPHRRIRRRSRPQPAHAPVS